MKLLLSALIVLSSTSAFAIPRAPFNALEKNLKSNSYESLSYDFEGIVKLSNCSGSLIIFNGMPTTAKAIVMTNGHCIQKPGGYLNPGEVWSNRPISRSMKVFDRNMKLHNIQTTKILYATMTNTDVAFYELDKSYDEIFKASQVRPFDLDTIRPLDGQSIDIISGYWDRGYSCNIHSFIHNLKEGAWTWTDSIRYTPTCDTIGGTSGSPIIARGERKVIAINNTSNESGQSCTLNNPCEVNSNGDINVEQGVRYGQQTFQVYTCLTPAFQIDLSNPNCQLPH
jgi:V8-like Glu-specific endopeptidase